MSAGSIPARSRAPTSGSPSTSASGPRGSTSRPAPARGGRAQGRPESSEQSPEAKTRTRPKETSNERTRQSRRLWRAERARDAHHAARAARPDQRDWAYLTESDLRRKWLASGEMEFKVGAPLEFVWRNSELTESAGQAAGRLRRGAPDGEPDHRAGPARRKLVFTWGKEDSDVSLALEPEAQKVLLTVVHGARAA